MIPTRAINGVKRLAKNSEYRRVYSKGRCFKGCSLWVYVLPTAEGKIRTGISVGKKVAAKSTVRNRLKRIIREWLRQNMLSALGRSCDIVVTAKRVSTANKKTAKRIRCELSAATKEARHFYDKKPDNKAG